MTQREYDRMTTEQLVGRRAVTRVELRSRGQTLPEGSVVTITGKWKGLEIETDQCEACHVKVRITRVPPEDVALFPRQEEHQP